jgi:hypothetical protein
MREAVDPVRPGDTLAARIAGGQPAAFLSALAERDHYRNLTIFTGLLIAPYPVLLRPGVRLIGGFYGPIERILRSMGGKVENLPADFIGWERYAMTARPLVVGSALSPMDEHGFLSFGAHSGATSNAFLEAARDPQRLAIGEISAEMACVLGQERHGGNRIHISEIDCVVATDHPLFVLPEIAVVAQDAAIADQIEELIENGATLKLAIGAIPNIVAQLLAEGKKGKLGILTEMLADGIMRLHRAGKVTNHNAMYDGFSVCTLAAGSRELYEGIDRKPKVRMFPVMQVNDPAVIRRNRTMMSINGALAVDLAGPGNGRRDRSATVLRRRRARAVRHGRARQPGRQERDLPALDRAGGGHDDLDDRGRARSRRAGDDAAPPRSARNHRARGRRPRDGDRRRARRGAHRHRASRLP